MTDEDTRAGTACDHARVSTLVRDVREDLRRYRRGDRGLLSVLGLLSTPQIAATLLHRISHCLFARRHLRAARALASLNLHLHKVAFSPASCVGGGLYLAFPAGLVFEGRAGRHLSLYTRCVCFSGGPALTGPVEAAPRLGDHVSIGAHGAVLGRVRVGSRVRIGFNVAVRSDVPADRVVLSRGMLARAAPGEGAGE